MANLLKLGQKSNSQISQILSPNLRKANIVCSCLLVIRCLPKYFLIINVVRIEGGF